MRARLPDRRPSITLDFEVGGLPYTATVSCFADGRFGKVFINNHKNGSAADVAARDAAIACSLALQCGADVEVIRRAITRDANGNASGPLGTTLDIIAAAQA
jgi:hypothetical protein